MENNAVFQSIDEILSKVNLNDVTSESNGREKIPDGYYYTTMAHFVDGTVLMSEIMQK